MNYYAILVITLSVILYLAAGLFGAILVGGIVRGCKDNNQDYDEIELQFREPEDTVTLKILQAISIILGPLVPAILLTLAFGLCILSLVAWIYNKIVKRK